MNEIVVSILLILIFFISIYMKSSFIIITVLIGGTISVISSIYGYNFELGKLSFFSEIAISFIFFSLGLGYSINSFAKNLKKTIVASLIDLLNFFIPFIIIYISTQNLIISFGFSLAIYPSSTAITVKILEFKKKLVSKVADVIVGILIFEDIVIIVTLYLIQALNQSKFGLSYVIILSAISLLTIYLLSKFIFERKSLILERYIQEESGIFLVLGYFLCLHFTCSYFEIPETLTMFIAGLLIPISISTHIKPKIETLKNFSIGLFILEFMTNTKISMENINYILLILLPILVLLKVFFTFLAFKLSKIKFNIEDNLYTLPRGEFTAYISKIYNIEFISFISIIFSNLIFFLYTIKESLHKKRT